MHIKFAPVLFAPSNIQYTTVMTSQIRSYYGISRNLLIKFKDDTIDETSVLAQILSSESAISSMLDMSIRSLPGDHGLPLQQVNLFSKIICLNY